VVDFRFLELDPIPKVTEEVIDGDLYVFWILVLKIPMEDGRENSSLTIAMESVVLSIDVLFLRGFTMFVHILTMFE